MNGRKPRLRAARALAWLLVIATVAGCRVGRGRDVTSEKPYADFIGARYSVVAENLYAYGVYDSLNDRTLSRIDLVPVRIVRTRDRVSKDASKGPDHQDFKC